MLAGLVSRIGSLLFRLLRLQRGRAGLMLILLGLVKEAAAPACSDCRVCWAETAACCSDR